MLYITEGLTMIRKVIYLSIYPILIAGIFLCLSTVVQAQTGNIYATNKWAWGTNIGWVNFRPTHGGVTVYYDHLEGYAWAENIGWIRLGTHTGGSPFTYGNTSNIDYGVNHNGSGTLSGYAWGTNVGWINFSPTHGGVTIDMDNGSFDGYAWAENVGWLHFKKIGSPAYNVVTTDPSLPVELSSFTIKVQPDGILIKWVTESEVDNLGFIIDRSLQGDVDSPSNGWIQIASYYTHDALKGQANSPFKTEYQFVDQTAESGKSYLYRLSDVSMSGEVHIYDVIEMAFTKIELPKETALEPAYPNPFNPQTKIAYKLAEETVVNLTVYNMMGRIVQILVDKSQVAGIYHAYWNGKNSNQQPTTSGAYLLVLKTGNTTKIQKVLLLR